MFYDMPKCGLFQPCGDKKRNMAEAMRATVASLLRGIER